MVSASLIFIPSSAMAITRKRCEEETVLKIEKKQKASMEDRLSDLPEALQLHILASLGIKHAVQTSVLSRTWVSMWTRIPVLEFSDIDFNHLHVFDKFVYSVLRHRDHSVKLERLKFIRSKTSSAKILKSVFDYASLFGVKQLEVHLQHSRNNTWPVCLRGSFESLTSLNLQSNSNMSCPFLVPMSISFKNLTVLYLKSVVITDPDPFSGFPVLERLTLINCNICMEGETLRVHALQLSDLTISSYGSINGCDVTTPSLRLFDYRGPEFPLLRIHEGLPVLETVVIDFNGVCYHKQQQKRMFDDMMAMFCTLRNVKSLTLFSSIVHLLSLFPDDLARRSSPFCELKNLTLDFRYLHWQNLFGSKPSWSVEPFRVPLDVKAYLLPNSPDAKFTIVYPNRVLMEYNLM